MKTNTELTLYMRAANVGYLPSVDALSLSVYCYLKYTRTIFQVEYTLKAPYIAYKERCYKVDHGEQWKEVVNDLDQNVRHHDEFRDFEQMIIPCLEKLELVQLHYLYQKYPTFDWALDNFASIKERLGLNLSEKKAIELMGCDICREISEILKDNVTLFRILLNADQWPGSEEDVTTVEIVKDDLTKNICWDFNPCTSLDVILTRILWVISELVGTHIYDEFIKYPNLLAYVKRFLSKFVKTEDAVDLSSRSGSYDFVEGLIEQSDCIGSGSYCKVYSCEFPQGNPLDLPGGTYAVKALTDAGAYTYHAEAQYLRLLQNEFSPHLFGYGDDGARRYFIMEYLSGGTLTEKIGELEYGEALTIMIDVCNGVHAIHSHLSHGRLIHDDLAPRNILLTKDGRAKVIDFGIVSYVGCDTQQTGSIYRERKMDKNKGQKSMTQFATQTRDIFSIGILIIELFTDITVKVNRDTADMLEEMMLNTPSRTLMREKIRNSGCDNDRAQAILHLALSCVQLDRLSCPKAYQLSYKLSRLL